MVPDALAELLASWEADPERAERIVHVAHVPARPAEYGEPDPPLPAALTDRLTDLGITRLYRHQVEVIDRVRRGVSTVVVAGTASGKSLGYQIPIVEAVIAENRTAALLLFPTKALARDQHRSLSGLAPPELVAAVYDGDTDHDDRRWIRRNANTVLTNPDMLHVGILPNHGAWQDFFHRLRFVVVDELHTLRGVFGTHVGLILRRLRRVAAHYGADPVFVFTSATIGNPGELAAALCGSAVDVVDRDAAPTGDKRYVLWNPELVDETRGIRAGALGEATRVFADLVGRDLHTIAFTRSRKAAELLYRWAGDRLDDERAERIAPYRGGYLAADRRRIEERLFSGQLLGVAATNALELGIDVGGLDAAVITTFPGTLASFRQQAGRAGRTRRESLAVLIAGQDALDQYYMAHPAELFSRPSEAAVVNPDNPDILTEHVACAAHEIPLVPEDRRWLGDGVEEAATRLVAEDRLRVRAGRLIWVDRTPPAPGVSIRTSSRTVYEIGVIGTGDLLGSIDEDRAFSQCHPGAVYLHQGDTYLVEELDLDLHEVRVRPADLDYYTQPRTEKDLRIVATDATATVGRLTAALGTVEVEEQVLGYQRKEIRSGTVLDTIPLDLPARTLRTQAFWYPVGWDLLDAAGLEWRDVPGTLHAVEHTAIAMLPLFAICDRWDVGGLSTALHPDLAEAVFFIYDGYPGGAGIAPIGHRAGRRHLAATRDAIDGCPCRAGCPSCIQSPKCGNFNDPLDKAGASRLLGVALDGVPPAG